MADPAVRSFTTQAQTNANPCSCGKPSGLTVGDLLLFILRSNGDPPASGPSGFTHLVTASGGYAGNALRAWTKVADAGDVAASAFTVANGSGYRFGAILYAIKDYDEVEYAVAANAGGPVGAPHNFDLTGFDPVIANDLLISLGGGNFRKTAVTQNNNPSWTEDFFDNSYGDMTALHATYASVAATGYLRSTDAGSGNDYPHALWVAISPLVETIMDGAGAGSLEIAGAAIPSLSLVAIEGGGAGSLEVTGAATAETSFPTTDRTGAGRIEVAGHATASLLPGAIDAAGDGSLEIEGEGTPDTIAYDPTDRSGTGKLQFHGVGHPTLLRGHVVPDEPAQPEGLSPSAPEVVITSPSGRVVRLSDEVENLKTSRVRKYGCETATFDLKGYRPERSYDELSLFSDMIVRRRGRPLWRGRLTDPGKTISEDERVVRVTGRGYFDALSDFDSFRTIYSESNLTAWQELKFTDPWWSRQQADFDVTTEPTKLEVNTRGGADYRDDIFGGAYYWLYEGVAGDEAADQYLTGLRMALTWYGYTQPYSEYYGGWVMSGMPARNLFPTPRGGRNWPGVLSGFEASWGGQITLPTYPLDLTSTFVAYLTGGHAPEAGIVQGHWTWQTSCPAEWISKRLWLSLYAQGDAAPGMTVDTITVNCLDKHHAVLDTHEIEMAYLGGEDYVRYPISIDEIPATTTKISMDVTFNLEQTLIGGDPAIYRSIFLTGVMVTAVETGISLPDYRDGNDYNDQGWEWDDDQRVDDCASGQSAGQVVTDLLSDLGHSLFQFELWATADPLDADVFSSSNSVLLYSRNVDSSPDGPATHTFTMADLAACPVSPTALVAIIRNISGVRLKFIAGTSETAPAYMPGFKLASTSLHATSIDTDGTGAAIIPEDVIADIVSVVPAPDGSDIVGRSGLVLSELVFEDLPCTKADAILKLDEMLDWELGYDTRGGFYLYKPASGAAINPRDIWVLPYTQCLVDLTPQSTDVCNEVLINEVLVQGVSPVIPEDQIVRKTMTMDSATTEAQSQQFGELYLADHLLPALTGTITPQVTRVKTADGIPRDIESAIEGQWVLLKDAPASADTAERQLQKITRVSIDFQSGSVTIEIGAQSNRLDRLVARLAAQVRKGVAAAGGHGGRTVATGGGGEPGAPGEPGDPGAPGEDGADGLSVLVGTGVPGAGLGVVGQCYIDTAAWDIYVKGGGGWGSPTTMIGPKGDDGAPGAGYGGTSATSWTISVDTKAFTTQAGFAYVAGQRVRIAHDQYNYAEGVVISYIGTALTVATDRAIYLDAGPYTDWTIGIAGEVGNKGDQGDTGAGYLATSTTSLLIETGEKVFTTQAGLAYAAGARVRASSAADPGVDFMEGVCTAYTGTTLTIDIDYCPTGTGTHTDWDINLAGDPGPEGPPGETGEPGPLTDFYTALEGIRYDLILKYKGTVAGIPETFHLCDGGTYNGHVVPDLRDKFIVGAKQDDAGVAKTNVTGALTQAGGANSHHHANHTFTQPSDHATQSHADGAVQAHTLSDTESGVAAHTHSAVSTAGGGGGAGIADWTVGGASNARNATFGTTGAYGAVAASAHGHGFTQPTSHPALAHAGGAVNAHDTLAQLPPYYALAFIAYVGA